MDKNGQRWTTMDNTGQQWATMDIDNNGQQWTTMHDNGQQWTHNGQQWTTIRGATCISESLMLFFACQIQGCVLLVPPNLKVSTLNFEIFASHAQHISNVYQMCIFQIFYK